MLRSKKIMSLHYLFFLNLIAAALMVFSSCEKEPYFGYDGKPGKAFISLMWVDAKPDYIDAGTGDIPHIFEWGRYYRTYPGINRLYYDGQFWNGHNYSFYAWEMDYEIWENLGEPGGYGYNGRNGSDNYFTLELSPFGPYIYTNDLYKDVCNCEVLIDSTAENEITVTKISENFTLKINFTKVEKRAKSEE
jgi:hypothetical protein